MSVLFRNACLVDLDPPQVATSDLRVDGDQIVARGRDLAVSAGDSVIECRGAVVMPGLVNGHTHLYSALAVGMPLPDPPPRDFEEILARVWWRLDQALDLESIEVSARVGAIAAVSCGTTTLIDHHASPRAITGALDAVERGLDAVGLRGVLCYEVTDRHGQEGREAGLAENARYLSRCAARGKRCFAGLVGAHASFTLDDASLEALAAMARRYKTGVHIHVAEDPCDERDALARGAPALISRLDTHGILEPHALLAHGTHLDAEAIARVNTTGCAVAHNPRSNMNNAVGYAPLARLTGPRLLGTDGLGGDLFAEAHAAWYVSRHEHAGLAPGDFVAMLAAAARRASQALGVTLGKLEVGAVADIVVTNNCPATPLDPGNLAAHLIFGLSARHVRDVMVRGVWVVRDWQVVPLDTDDASHEARRVAAELWQRMAEVP